MSEEPPYILEVRGLPAGEPSPDRGQPLSGTPWIGVRFECCGVYTRIYRNKEGTAYAGACPRCQAAVCVSIGPGGTTSRLFRAT